MIKRTARVGCLLVALLVAPAPTFAQTDNARGMLPVIYYLLQDIGEKFITTMTGKLNDTGLDWGGDYASGNNDTPESCSGSDGTNPLKDQDCHQGRDATHDDDSDGHAGFSLVKLDSQGRALPVSATSWSCVGDTVTGLMWETKKDTNNSDKDSLHDGDDTYTWYNTDSTKNGGHPGSNGSVNNTCFGYSLGAPGSYCNTQQFVDRVNAAGWCGYSDWRLPSSEELRSIIDYSTREPTIDSLYFANSIASRTWTASPYAPDSDQAWIIDFNVGHLGRQLRTVDHAVRLVRGGGNDE